MHITSLAAGEEFANTYIDTTDSMTLINSNNFKTLKKIVVDLGGLNVNGSLREYYETKGYKYICVDVAKDPSVDITINIGDKLPFDNESIDFIVSSSAFEHDPLFWMTFKEMCRIIKPEGYIFINAPSTGKYHSYPTDNYRFYLDASQSLAYWSGIELSNIDTYPVKVIETFHISGTEWNDFCCIWKKTDKKEKSYILPEHIINNKGPLEIAINNREFLTYKK